MAAIVGWLEKGAALPDMLALLNGEETGSPPGWLEVQEALLAPVRSDATHEAAGAYLALWPRSASGYFY
ncbi:Uncharacterised protein [Cedecea neteri]|uniref:Uncharacterized protein n=1 Tax=Cedecea neteri TaxID=158822 RepID=A0A2X3IZ52_9ENTR|nr:Uncharacterised protein [Cedecea neteri]